MVNEADERQKDGLACRRLNDGRFADACSVQINVRAFRSIGFVDFEVKKLDDVADEVRKLPNLEK